MTLGYRIEITEFPKHVIRGKAGIQNALGMLIFPCNVSSHPLSRE